MRYNRIISPPVVTFDAGQTLVELDLDVLARRLGERGRDVPARALEAAAPAGWARYDALVKAGAGHPWKALMTTLLEGAGLGEDVPALVDWLWSEQPRQNLWRKPIPDPDGLDAHVYAPGWQEQFDRMDQAGPFGEREGTKSWRR